MTVDLGNGQRPAHRTRIIGQQVGFHRRKLGHVDHVILGNQRCLDRVPGDQQIAVQRPVAAIGDADLDGVHLTCHHRRLERERDREPVHLGIIGVR